VFSDLNQSKSLLKTQIGLIKGGEAKNLDCSSESLEVAKLFTQKIFSKFVKELKEDKPIRHTVLAIKLLI
jgi:hypothetical protein